MYNKVKIIKGTLGKVVFVYSSRSFLVKHVHGKHIQILATGKH